MQPWLTLSTLWVARVFRPLAKKGKELRQKAEPAFAAHKGIFHSPGSLTKGFISFKTPMGGAECSWSQKTSKLAEKSSSSMMVAPTCF